MKKLMMTTFAMLMAFCATARDGDMIRSATLAVIDTRVHTVFPSSVASFDTVIRQMLTSDGRNLNTTSRGMTFVFR